LNLKSSNTRTEEFNKIGPKKFYRKLLSKNPTIIDIGANKGQTIVFFKKIFPKLKIFAFEPSETYEFLEKKYQNDKNIKLSNVAIDKKKGKKKFYYHKFKSHNTSGLSGFYKVNKDSKDHIRLRSPERNKILKEINFSYSVNCMSLDDIFFKKINIDLLKIDTQGNELNVLKGSKKLLKNIKFIKLELMLYDYYEKSYSISDIELFLKKFNFKIFNILEVQQNPVNFKTDWIEVLFFNKSFISD
jgi:FkbM family methyltransferase